MILFYGINFILGVLGYMAIVIAMVRNKVLSCITKSDSEYTVIVIVCDFESRVLVQESIVMNSQIKIKSISNIVYIY